MKILVLTDVHGDYTALGKILDGVRESADLVICPGDFTDMFNIPADFSQMDIANMVLQKLLSLNRPLFCIPGNQDPYEILEQFDEYKANLHDRIRKFQELPFIGWGGALTPFNTIFEPSEEETRAHLDRLGAKVAGRFVLVVHNPPKNTGLDRVASGEHVGSQAIREFILKKSPLLVLSAHIHEARGSEMLGKSKLFYPGPVFEGCYGIVDIDGERVKCEIKKI